MIELKLSSDCSFALSSITVITIRVVEKLSSMCLISDFMQNIYRLSVYIDKDYLAPSFQYIIDRDPHRGFRMVGVSFVSCIIVI